MNARLSTLNTLFAVISALLWVGAGTALAQAPSPHTASSAIDAVARDVCGKKVVLLGEPPVHGFGKVLDFKVELVRRLIDACHFDGLFFESGTYDFLNIESVVESGKPVTADMIQAAIGGIWANQETERLIPDLLRGVQSGKLKLGGLDDQLSRGTYAQRDMPADLVQYLDGKTKDECLSTLQRHTLWQYTDAAPYGAKDNARIVSCLDKIAAAASAAHTKKAERDLAMVSNLKRVLARDFPAPAPADVDVWSANERDRSMYQNFQWLRSRMPAGSKIIIWTATVHAAKDLNAVPGNKRVSMGSFVHRDLGGRAFSLGFSAYAGSYAFGRQPVRTLPTAPDDSLEGRAFARNDLPARYFNRKDLRKFGVIAARPLGVDFKTAEWDKVFDGLVIFREEHPPTVSR